jgi:hypothetical protein
MLIDVLEAEEKHRQIESGPQEGMETCRNMEHHTGGGN